MILSVRVFGGVALAALIASVSTAALAQAAGMPGPDHAPPTAEQREAWMQQHQAHRREAMEAHAKRLHDILNLRPDQDAALRTFLTAMAPPREDRMRDRPHGEERLTTPQRLDRMAQRLAERQTEFQTRAAAIRQFYAALSPEQQRAFDALPPRMDGERHEGPHGPGGWDHPGMERGRMGHDAPEPGGPQ